MLKERNIVYGTVFRLAGILVFNLVIVFGGPACSRTTHEGNRVAEENRVADENWVTTLTETIGVIDKEVPGDFGVYIKGLDDDQAIKWNADRLWYLSSTVKVPVAVALLVLVEEGKISLSEKLTLSKSDYVDGAGDLLWTDPGTEHSLRILTRKMLVESDNTAADMLIRLIGEDELNRLIRERMVESGFNPFTTLLQVRYDAYSEIHKGAVQLSNLDFVEIHAQRERSRRYDAFVGKLRAEPKDIKAKSIEEAFERYYARELNSATLEAYGLLLERLVKRELLSEDHTELIIEMMKNIVTGDHRIKAGLPKGVPFAQKTGTQIERACNMGIINPDRENALIIAACAENFGNLSNAEDAFQRLGSALSKSGLLNR